MKVHIGFIAALALSSCSSQEAAWQSDKQASEASRFNQSISTEGMPQDCFFPREINDWESVNRVNLIVYAGVKARAWLVTIAPPAVDLRSSVDIRFEAEREVCGYAGERLVIDRPGGRIYGVIDVRRLDKETLERVLEENKPASTKPGAEPASGDGEVPAKPKQDLGGAI